MAVNTTGNKNLDSMVTGELVLEALDFCYKNDEAKWLFCLKIIYGNFI